MFIFDGESAKKYGIHAAVLLNGILNWMDIYEFEKTYMYDNKCWIDLSPAELAETHNFLTVEEIAAALEVLVNKNILLKRVENNIELYTFTDEFRRID